MMALKTPPEASGARILLVDDDPGLLRLLTLRLEAEGHEIEAVESAAAALAALPRFRPDLVITDLRMEGMDGLELLREIRRARPGLRVLLLTAHGTIPDAVEATQSGAFGFLTKPVDKAQLLDQVNRALELSAAPASVDAGTGIFTRNAQMQEVLAQIAPTAAGNTPVLISGPTGSGRRRIARAIHDGSSRAGGPYRIVDATTADEAELAEVYGGACEGGTLVVEAPEALSRQDQGRLLQLVEHRSDNGDEAHASDVRVIALIDGDAKSLVLSGDLREDLCFRLAERHLRVPGLEDRREDIPLLVEGLLAEFAREQGGSERVCAPEALELLSIAAWPGQVLELDSVIRQAAAQAPGPVISVEQLRPLLNLETAGALPSYAAAREEFTRDYLSRLLHMTGGNVSQAARLARRNRTDFYKLLNRHDVNPDAFKPRRR